MDNSTVTELFFKIRSDQTFTDPRISEHKHLNTYYKIISNIRSTVTSDMDGESLGKIHRLMELEYRCFKKMQDIYGFDEVHVFDTKEEDQVE